MNYNWTNNAYWLLRLRLKPAAWADQQYSVGHGFKKQEAQLMLTTGSTRLAVSRGQQTWYPSTCYMFPIVQ